MNETQDIQKLSNAIMSLASTITEIINDRLKGIPAPLLAPEPKPLPIALPSEMNNDVPRLAYTMRETATILGVSYITVHRLLQRGLLKSTKSLRHKIISRKEIERFLKETV